MAEKRKGRTKRHERTAEVDRATIRLHIEALEGGLCGHEPRCARLGR
jgi:hypothetical protein